MFKKSGALYLLMFMSVFSFNLVAQSMGGIEGKVSQALNADFRTDRDRDADLYRLPAETLAFLGLKDNMQVMELMPGRRGYYTKILGQVLADNGKLHLGLDGQAVAEELPKWGLNKVEILEDHFELTPGEPKGYNHIGEALNFPVSKLDMVLTFRNLHDFSPDSQKLLNTQVFKTLKSGGIYGVIDHTRRHMEPYNAERWRRIDPVWMIKQMQDIGFEFVDYSDLHYREHDPLKTDTTTPDLNRDSDRFTLIFRKP